MDCLFRLIDEGSQEYQIVFRGEHQAVDLIRLEKVSDVCAAVFLARGAGATLLYRIVSICLDCLFQIERASPG